jgi:hypothetical protein
VAGIANYRFEPMTDDEDEACGRNRGSPPLTLREACAHAGLDRYGERCPDCPIGELCRSEVRWLVSAVPPRGWRS